ncbi:uncharacterized protein LOC129911280 [Episyrphus balteatus]|uniref:uncharacterized protein LOC129911280 n=1 Tax=Episyrphus balteatus TaxID=286459 RepID=UPI0024861B26|nr:uncharacterized protein LOC129911280 [Episyrphus balteatus]
MAHYTESDVTYCSDAEKEETQPIRRSKRLSQRNLLPRFRSHKDPPTQRLLEIYQMLKCGKLCSDWQINEWQAQRLEVELIKNTLNGKQKGRISFILKKINQNIQNLSSKPSIKSAETTVNSYSNNEQVIHSPNILAGMMTEVLTEIPPYQPQNLSKITKNIVKNSEPPKIGLTQRNPLDLTKKHGRLLPSTPALSEINLSKRQQQQQQQSEKVTSTPISLVPSQQNEKAKSSSFNTLSISKDSMIDLTDENVVNENQENIEPEVIETNARPRSPVHVSKWLKFLPTPERPKLVVKPKPIPATVTAPNRNRKTFKESIVSLYKAQSAQSNASTGLSSKTANPFASGGYSKKSKQTEKSKPSSSPFKSRFINENVKQTSSHRNTQNIPPRRNEEQPRITPRNFQSEHFSNISPNFLLDDLSDSNDNLSFSSSCKEDFKKMFGTDNLDDVFNCRDEAIYHLNENHVKRLAKILNLNVGTLKKTIDTIISNDNYGISEDDIPRSDSSVVECSQSPPQRLLQSQRSHISK